MANSYLSDDGVTTLISLTKNELKKKASSVNGITPDVKGNVTLTSKDVPFDENNTDYSLYKYCSSVNDNANSAKTLADSIKAVITSGDTALYTSTDASNPLSGTLTPLFATKTELNDAIGGITSIKAEVVTELPTIGVSGIIYLVSHAHGAGDAYDEYLWIESAKKFEKIGNTDIDLSSYAKKTDLDPYLTKELAASTYTTTTEFLSYLENFAKKTDLDSYLTTANASSTYVAKADLTEITSTKVTELWNSIS